MMSDQSGDAALPQDSSVPDLEAVSAEAQSLAGNYVVYVALPFGAGVASEREEKTDNWFGRLVEKSNSLGTAETLEESRRMALQHLGSHCTDSVYVVDRHDKICEVVRNESFIEYQRECASGEYWSQQAIPLLLFCMISYVGTVILTGVGWPGLMLFGGLTLLHLLVVRLRIENEVESGCVCVLLLLIVYALFPWIQAARDKARQDQQNEQVMQSQWSQAVNTNSS